MASTDGNDCSKCAYVDKSGQGMWCRFHDVSVNNKLVCDNFLDEFQSPQWIALAAGMNGAQKKSPQFLLGDILIYALTAVAWVLCLLCVVYGCTMTL